MKPRAAPCSAIAAVRLAMSVASSPWPLERTSPVQAGRAYFGVPPSFATRSRKRGKSFRSAGALRFVSPEKPS